MDWTTIGQKCVLKTLKVLDGFGNVKTFDDGNNPHTDADLVAHKALVATLEASGVQCELVSEEYDQKIAVNGGGNTKVFIDPIDGTSHFIRGERAFCAVGLFVVENGRPTYSFVGDVATGDIYHCDNERSFRNGDQIRVPQTVTGKNILAGWAPYSPRFELFYDKIKKLPQDEFVVFNFGEMLQSAKIAVGRYDACFEILPAKLQEFAGAIIALRAGGELSTLEGAPIVWGAEVKQTMLVSRNKEIHQKILTAFNE